MIVDTSALLAILFAEPDAERFAEALVEAEEPKISAANYLEAGIVVDSRGGPGRGRQLDALMRRLAISIEPVTEEQAQIARQAHVDFGKGNHPAGLNFGDCLAYALARTTGETLLFKGDDFSRTDLIAHL